MIRAATEKTADIESIRAGWPPICREDQPSQFEFAPSCWRWSEDVVFKCMFLLGPFQYVCGNALAGRHEIGLLETVQYGKCLTGIISKLSGSALIRYDVFRVAVQEVPDLPIMLRKSFSNPQLRRHSHGVSYGHSV